MKSNALSVYLAVVVIVSICMSFTQASAAQIPQDSTDMFKGRAVLAAAFRYQNIPHEWDIPFYGFAFEYYVSDRFSISAPFYYGKGSDDLAYVHLPVGGILLILTNQFLRDIFFELGGLFKLSVVKYLFTENLHYNIRQSDRFILSPYFSFMGLDASECYGPDHDSVAMLGNGFGLQFRWLPSSHLTLRTGLELKYLYVMGDEHRSENKFGYNFSVDLGFIF